MKELISVIVPVYKVEELLPKCIESICDQTYSNLEIILVDDGSPDKCGEICDAYAEKDSRIRVIHQENAGLAGARNAGLKIAKGTYIGFVDSDDHIAADMYEVMYENINKYSADIAICGRYMEFESGELVPMFHYDEIQEFDSKEAARRFLLSDGFDAAAWDKLYRREIWGDLEYPLKYVSEDVPVTAELLMRAKKVVHCGKPLIYYYQRAGSLSHAAFQEKSAGLYYFFKETAERIKANYVELEEEANFFYYKAMLVLLFRYVGKNEKHPVGEECIRQVKKNIISICKNRYLKKKYKIFACALCTGIAQMAVKVSDALSINDNSLTK